MRDRTSFSKPFIIDKTKFKAATPIRTPPTEIMVMTETNLVFLLDFRYLLAMKNSYDIKKLKMENEKLKISNQNSKLRFSFTFES